MFELISETHPKARKDYTCMACEFLRDEIGHFNPTQEEQVIIDLAESWQWKIKKGMRYLKQVTKYEGDLCTFRAIPEIHAICEKYDLYPEV